ncbi:hypothetical protein Py17XNL_001205346 [Plasmodium yoelii yoelii]|uniref:Uncharacterized protein n=1 Tax=Plasmodium yoelii yoelii TaxID=73239 RepID=A0AAF0B6N9_PLAYO|nr:hypothetical protein Py17XNL_001205346 [Plasmodium yoelii yoelii]
MCNIVSNNENKNLNLMDNFNNNIFEHRISGDSIPVSGTSVVSSIFGEEVSNPEKDMIEIKGNPGNGLENDEQIKIQRINHIVQTLIEEV